jgi:hypothetical protein
MIALAATAWLIIKRAEPRAKAWSFPKWCRFRGTPRSKVVADYQSAQKALDTDLSPGFCSFRAADRL